MLQLDFPKSLVWPTSCGHSLTYITHWERSFCGLCFLQFGYADEVPGRLHRLRTLADNGKPDQTGQFQGHVRVVEGITLPVADESMQSFRRRRGKLKVENSRTPFATALWLVSGRQPPLAEPLIKAVVQRKDHGTIQWEMQISTMNLVERLTKGVNMATNYIRKYNG